MRLPSIINEPCLSYASGSVEFQKLKQTFTDMMNVVFDVPLVINGERIFTSKMQKQVAPSDPTISLCNFSVADEKLTKKAIDGALLSKADWERWPVQERAAVFLKAADLLSSDAYRFKVMAATMLGQGKTTWQAEIDCIAEMCDFWRFNARDYALLLERLNEDLTHPKQVWNSIHSRALDGFVLAVSPFNFTSIGGNLASAPAILGNTVAWKPSSKSILSNYLVYECLEEAGLPPGVIQFIPGPHETVVNTCLQSEWLAGVHFTGSTSAFQSIWQSVALNINSYRQFPRLVGETGGKNFHVVHESADPDHVAMNTVRAAFEYQGQKCSACSRLYIPKEMWESGGVKEKMIQIVNEMSIATSPGELLTSFIGPMIDEPSVQRCLNIVKNTNGKVLTGERIKDSQALRPFIIELTPKDMEKEIMTQEIFGPVLAVIPYEEPWESVLISMVDHDSQRYGLTGAIFAEDRSAIQTARQLLRHTAGNLYINTMCTGAVVGQQPFGGGRKSGTNDKAGSFLNLTRWLSVQSVKEYMGAPIVDYRYPSVTL